MRILYFADTRFPIERANGLQTMATCHALAERGHDVTLVVRAGGTGAAVEPFTFYGFPHVDGLHVHCVDGPAHPVLRRAGYLVSAITLATKSEGAVVLTRDLGVASFFLQVPGVRRKPVVYESHGMADIVAAELPTLLGSHAPRPSAGKVARLARREARVWRRSAAYVTITSALAADLEGRFGHRDRVFVVPDGARPIALSPASHDAGAPITVGYAGHLYPWKGVDVLVTALAAVPNVRGLIIGGHPRETDLARLQQLAGERGVSSRITFTGAVPAGQVAERLAAADILVLPNTASAISERYTSPLKLFEYLNQGRAIVASDLPAIREILRHDETALLVPPGNAEALAAALRALAAAPTLRTRLGRAAAAMAPEYTWARRAERLEAALQAAVA